jgi:hypothetical protein
VLGAIEMLFVRSAPVLPTLAQVESSLDSVADREGAGVLGDGLLACGRTGAAGGVLFVKVRVIAGDGAEGGAACTAVTAGLIVGALSGR